MSDIFQEVQEEYRREQMAQAWSKYRVPIVTGVAGLIFVVAAYQGWNFWHARMMEDASRQFERSLMAAQQNPGPLAAAGFAKLAHDGWGGYPVMARFQEAAVRAMADDKKGAVAIYDQLAQEGAGGTLLTDYARLRAALLLVDTAPLEEVKSRLEPLVTSGSPWRIEAEEFLAYAFWRAGNKGEGLRLLGLIQANPDATPAAKRRALEFATLINGGMKVSDLKAPPAAPAPAAATAGAPMAPILPSPGAPPATPTAPPPPTIPVPTTPTP